MTDDLLDRLHELPPGDLAAPADRFDRVMRRARARRVQRTAVVASVAMLVVAGAVAGVLAGTGPSSESLHVVTPASPPSTPSHGPSPSPTPTVTPPATLVPLGSVPRFIPQSFSFVSVDVGWAYGPASWPTDAGADGVLAQTVDGGRTWKTVAYLPHAFWGPGGGVNWVLFRDSRHGYLYGDRLFVTADGGRTWQQMATPGPVMQLVVAPTRLYAVVRGCPNTDGSCRTAAVYTAAFDGSRFERASGLPASGGQLAVGGSTIYLLAATTDNTHGPRLWASEDGSTWTSRAGPCTGAYADGGSLATFGRSGLALVCAGEPGAGTQQKSTYRSTDGGRHWSRRGTPSESGYVGDLTALDADTWVLGEARGGLLVTHDGGKTWEMGHLPSIATEDVNGATGWGEVQRLDQHHVAAVPAGLNARLIGFSKDAGDTWSVVTFIGGS